MKTVLLLHGALGSAAQLLPLQEMLQDVYDVHVINLPGHGGMGMPEDFSISSFADFIKDYCSNKHLQKVSIFGYSMGGYVGMYLASQWPDQVEKIITLGTKFHWNESIATKETGMLQPAIMKEKIPQYTSLLQQRHMPANWEELVKRTSDMLTGLGKNNLLQTSHYKRIAAPTLMMLGDRDKMVSMEETIAVYKNIPGAQLAILPATPHPLEQIDTVLLSFFVKRFIG